MKKFPDNFLWGAATSAFQVEGGIENNDWAQAARDGRVPPLGQACDHYRRFEADFDLVKSMGHNAHRFSIEWARIEPEEGKFDEKEIRHYVSVIRALRARGIEPFVTFWHWPMPLWLVKKGGLLSRDWPALFARYSTRMASAFGSDVCFYITINEPMVVTSVGYLAGMWPPFKHNPLAYFRAVSRLIHGHILCYREVKKVAPHSQIGISQNYIPFESTNIFGYIVAKFTSWWYNDHFLNRIKKFQDFIGVNHYFRIVFWQNKKQRAAHPRSDFEWELYPQAMYTTLKELQKYKLPIYVTENGLADATDAKRSDFLVGTLRAMHQAIADGVDVRGYLHWAFLDNYEWAEGFKMRFGLVAVDYDNNLTRTVRPSAKVYSDIIRANALPDTPQHES